MSFLNKVTVEDLNVKGRRVLVRVDFNVPLKDGKVTNDNRIVGAIPTIRYLADHGARVILCSHLGKPKGPDPAFTMAPVAARLAELMGRPVLFADDDTVVGENARRHEGRRYPGAAEYPLPSRGNQERPCLQPGAGLAGGGICGRRLRQRPPRPLLHRRRDRLYPGDRRGLPDGKRDQLPGQRRGAARPPAGGDPGRRQGGR